MATNVPTQNGNEEDPEQWDILKTIAEVEKLDEAMETLVQHTIKEMGRIVGYTPDGYEMLEHPIGEAVVVIQKLLRSCHARYGMELLKAGREMDHEIPELKKGK